MLFDDLERFRAAEGWKVVVGHDEMPAAAPKLQLEFLARFDARRVRGKTLPAQLVEHGCPHRLQNLRPATGSAAVAS